MRELPATKGLPWRTAVAAAVEPALLQCVAAVQGAYAAAAATNATASEAAAARKRRGIAGKLCAAERGQHLPLVGVGKRRRCHIVPESTAGQSSAEVVMSL